MTTRIRCSEGCRIGVRLLLDRKTARRLRLAAVVGRRSARLPAARRRNVTVKLTRRAARRLRRTRAVRVTVEVRATDAAGNVRTVRRRATLRR